MIIQILQHSPLWVWPLLLALIYLGYTQSRTRAVSRARLYALPVAMMSLSLYSLIATFGATPSGLAAWLAGAILAGLLSRVYSRPVGIGYAPDTRLYTIPGSWLPLTLILAIFATRYAVAATIAVEAALRQAGLFVAVAGLAYGFLSCTLLGRALAVVRAAEHAPPGVASQGI